MQKIKAKIHLKNVQDNAKTLKALSGGKLCAVVKANAYGHGAEEIVNALEGIADCFAVALIDEGIAIRTAACGKDVLVLTPPICEEEVFSLAVNGFVATVPDLWTARLVAKVCKERQLPLRVHLKVNTGMNRYGMNVSMLGKVCTFLQSERFVIVEGIYSHLYQCDYNSAQQQRALFLQMQAVCKRYYPRVISHLGGTYAALLGKDFALDMVRVGIGLYGYLPIKNPAVSLKKGMTVYATTVSSRTPSFGGLGYGKTYSEEELKNIGTISVCRVGYADGFLRKDGVGLGTLNTLCMDACLLRNKKRRGQFVPVLTDAEEIALRTGTITYEVLCAATRRAECIYDYE